MRSDDEGQTWQQGAHMSVADLDVDPGDPLRVRATAASGLVMSSDGGMSFEPEPAQPPQPLVLIDHGNGHPPVEGHGTPIVGVDAAGGLWTQVRDGWTARGRLPGPTEAFTVVDANAYLAATETGVVRSDNAGETWSVIAPSAG